jgi:hypothetical protein
MVNHWKYFVFVRQDDGITILSYISRHKKGKFCDYFKVDSETAFKKCYGLGMLPVNLANPNTVTLMIDFAKGIAI